MLVGNANQTTARVGIRSKFIGTLALLTVIVALLILVLQQALVRRAMIRQTVEQGAAIAQTIESTAGYYVIFGLTDDLKNIVGDLAKSASVEYADFLDASGKVLASTKPELPAALTNRAPRRESGTSTGNGLHIYTVPFYESKADAANPAAKPKGYFRLLMNESQAKLKSVVESVSSRSSTMISRVDEQRAIIDDTYQSVDQLNGGVRKITDNVEALSASSEETSSSMLEMVASMEEVSRHTDTLFSSVEETASATHQMVSSINEVDQNVVYLTNFVTDTSSSMVEMSASIAQVEANAARSYDLALAVADAADARHRGSHPRGAGGSGQRAEGDVVRLHARRERRRAVARSGQGAEQHPRLGVEGVEHGTRDRRRDARAGDRQRDDHARGRAAAGDGQADQFRDAAAGRGIGSHPQSRRIDARGDEVRAPGDGRAEVGIIDDLRGRRADDRDDPRDLPGRREPVDREREDRRDDAPGARDRRRQPRHGERHERGDQSAQRCDPQPRRRGAQVPGQRMSDVSLSRPKCHPEARRRRRISRRRSTGRPSAGDSSPSARLGMTTTAPHPPFSHLLPASGDKGNKLLVWRVAPRPACGARVALTEGKR